MPQPQSQRVEWVNEDYPNFPGHITAWKYVNGVAVARVEYPALSGR